MRLLNEDQRQCFKTIALISKDEDRKSIKKVFFIDGPAGTGKTFLLNTLLLYFRYKRISNITSASSGIAASVLFDGERIAHTIHKSYGVPVPCFENSICKINPASLEAAKIREASVLIFDECSMIHKDVINVVDKYVQEVSFSSEFMGGKLVIFTGDWRQCLPVIEKATRAEIVSSLISTLPCFKDIQTFRLTRNERLKSNESFAKQLLDIGNGNFRTYDRELSCHQTINKSMVKLPQNMIMKSDEAKDLVNAIYPRLKLDNQHSVTDGVILTPKNEDVDEINNICLDERPGNLVTKYASHFSQDNYLTTEDMQNSTPSNFPPSELHLKVGCPLILLRNLSYNKHLTNGTR